MTFDSDDDEEIESPPDMTRLFHTSSSPEDTAAARATQQRWSNRICSVLNLIVDYSMVPATDTYEQEEVLTQHLVPVLRVFGPIVRSSRKRKRRDLPSACLYIHNVFPYMIARPVLAGFDGRPELANCPWNSETAVTRMLSGLTDALEASLVDTTSNKTITVARPTTTTIRRITVVRGRGFYTYCDGPVAPFLRVEYYNPADRWKVKRALEQGLADLNAEYYHPVPEDGDDHQDDPELLLRFHCFEAHIPYTMQFFKDWNLSGMSYIHVDACQFREPLPRRGPSSFCTTASTGSLSDDDDDDDDEDAVFFLDSNTPKTLRHSNAPPLWKKETSCPIELDIDVSAILNVLDVITTSANEDDGPDVHWRAVPSLREIWMQERRRMAKLLAGDPALDFLNFPPSSPNSAGGRPGTRLAVQGMQQLVQVTPGLEENFRRAMTDIVERHTDAIERRDALLGGDDDDEHSPATPTHSQTIDALVGLAETSTEEDEKRTPTTPEESPSAMEPPCYQSLHQDSQPSSGGKFEALSQSFHARGHVAAFDVDVDDVALTQKIDRGDGVVALGPFETIEDVIDPQTLLPFSAADGEHSEDSEGEGRIDEKTFEEQLATMATQTLPSEGRKEQGSENPYYSDASSVDSLDLLSGSNFGVDNNHDGALRRRTGDGVVSDALLAVCNSAQEWKHPANVWISPTIHPPSRQDLTTSSRQTQLFPMTGPSEIPPWVSFLGKNRQKPLTTNASSTWSPEIGPSGVTVKPVCPPPSFGTVRSWGRRHPAEQQSTRSRGPDIVSTCKETVTKLRIDENSHQLVADTGLDENCGVEEVVVKSRVMENSNVSDDELDQNDSETRNEAKKPSLSLSNNQGSPSADFTVSTNSAPSQIGTPSPHRALKGLANQGGKLLVEGGGELKAKITQLTQRKDRPESGGGLSDSLSFPVTLFAVEIFVHCRTGKAGLNDSNTIALTADPRKDKVVAISYVYSRDPGGGESLQHIERGCLFVPTYRELVSCGDSDLPSLLKLKGDAMRQSLPTSTAGAKAPVSVECLSDERRLLLRFSSIVRLRDPDILLSWDPQSCGLGYIIERGSLMGQGNETAEQSRVDALDLVRLLGRNPTKGTTPNLNRDSAPFEEGDFLPGTSTDHHKENQEEKAMHQWKGSGLGAEWDDRVGPGAAAASIQGRLVFSAWKIVAEEVKHPNCSYLPAVMSSVLNKRVPWHNDWYGVQGGRERWRVIHYCLVRCVSSLQLFDALDVIGRSGEAARLSGVEFSQSFPGIRGSQYKVEGVLLRALQSLNSNERGSKKGLKNQTQSVQPVDQTLEDTSQSQSPWKRRRLGLPKSQVPCSDDHNHGAGAETLGARSFFFFSPSLKDTNKQEALEVQALTLEPKSGHQTSPVVVCDFTALYPSIVIAYNLCYSTCSGKLDYHSTRSEMRTKGRATGRVGPVKHSEERMASVLKHHVGSLDNEDPKSDRAYISPNGVAFVSETVVKGVLPQVLHEMLSTRAMLKRASKQYKSHAKNLAPAVLRQLEARQLALKYVANVTYGYTSATFSGRCAMPLLADTIVECGRRTLTRAINTANSWGEEVGGRWSGCRVIYGDTDSVFVHLPGRTVAEAFVFGKEFCQEVSRSNPPPVQLKLEKVYLGSMMQTVRSKTYLTVELTHVLFNRQKKKYCGMKYESPDQRQPTFDAKGIETVRRDQCALTKKVLRNTLIALFQQGLESAKSYLIRQWHAIISDQVPVSDFILTGRVRSRYRGGRTGPVQASLARRLMEADPGFRVRHKQRQPYVIVSAPGVSFKLKDCVLTPMELLEQWDAFSVHAGYYIERHVNAAVQRCLGLAPYFVDVSQWFKNCNKPRRRVHYWHMSKSRNNTSMISNFFGSDKCSICGSKCATSGRSKVSICRTCCADEVKVASMAMQRLNNVQKKAQQLAQNCSTCNLCFEDVNSFAPVGKRFLETPIANCTCIDCPTTYRRHRITEQVLETTALVETLDQI